MNQDGESPNLGDIPTFATQCRQLGMIRPVAITNHEITAPSGLPSHPDDVSSPPFQIHPLRSYHVEALQSSYERGHHNIQGSHEIATIFGSSRGGSTTAGSPGGMEIKQGESFLFQFCSVLRDKIK
jgi:hypothetical protein